MWAPDGFVDRPAKARQCVFDGQKDLPRGLGLQRNPPGRRARLGSVNERLS